MMSKDFLKKAGILGVSFGLVASPLAFAQTDEDSAIDENQGITVEEQPLDTQSHDKAESGDYEEKELTTDHNTQGPDTVGEPNSTDASGDQEYTPEEVVEENSAD
tara:strand:+ start:1028 stop:1342 length:315 start_codon:yes stop_codon:yes gene_type:complete